MDPKQPAGGFPDLRRPARWAADCIRARLDAKQGGRPFFRARVEAGRIVALEHASWDFGDMTGRFLEGLLLVQAMGAGAPADVPVRRGLERYLLSLLGADGLVRDLDTGQPDHLFAQGSALFGLVTAWQAKPSRELGTAIERLVAGLRALGRHERGRTAFPQVATPRGACVNHGGYPILPLVRWYELTGHRPALELAKGISRWVLADPSPNERGEIAATGWEGHLHAWLDTYCGILRCARAGADLGCDVEERVAALYAWVRRTQATRFGWVADSVGSATCETCTISSLIRLALTLVGSSGSAAAHPLDAAAAHPANTAAAHPSNAGADGYFDDVDRAFRNQLLENQYCRPAELPLADPALLPAVAGAFESWARPNTLLQGPDIEGCCINGGLRALHLVWQHALQFEPRNRERPNRESMKGEPEISVNFWIERPGPTLSISPAHQGERAMLTVCAHETCRVRVRRPAGSTFVDVAAGDERSGDPVAQADRPWLDLGRLHSGEVRRVRVRLERSHERVVGAGGAYTVDWLGPWVERLAPVDPAFGLYRPFADRPALAGEEVRPAEEPSPEILW